MRETLTSIVIGVDSCGSCYPDNIQYIFVSIKKHYSKEKLNGTD